MTKIVRRPLKDPVLSFFEDFLGSQLPKFDNVGKDVVPSVNIKDSEKQAQIDLAAPGLSKKDFDISVDHNTLTVSAHKEEEKIEEGANFVKKEFGFEKFQRSFTLPEDIFDTENIKAAYKNGVLEIIIPKKEEEQKKIKKVLIS